MSARTLRDPIKSGPESLARSLYGPEINSTEIEDCALIVVLYDMKYKDQFITDMSGRLQFRHKPNFGIGLGPDCGNNSLSVKYYPSSYARAPTYKVMLPGWQ